MSGQIIHFRCMTDAPNRIRELRMAKGWSIQRLADALPMSKMNLSAIERGQVLLNINHMRSISRAMGCSPDDLLAREDNPNLTSAEERELLDRLRAASPATREQVLKMAHAILPDPHESEHVGLAV